MEDPDGLPRVAATLALRISGPLPAPRCLRIFVELDHVPLTAGIAIHPGAADAARSATLRGLTSAQAESLAPPGLPSGTMKNEGYVYRETVDDRAAGARVIDWLSERYRHSDRETWLERIEAGQVRLDAAVAGPQDRLQLGQVLSWHREAWIEEPVPRRFDLIHEDDDLLAVSKPSGLPTMPAGGFYKNTLWSLVRERFPDADPAHRLGRGTSGLVLFGRSPAANAALAAAFREHEVRRTYLALIQGRPAWTELHIETPIGPVDHPLLGTLHAASSTGKRAQSDARLLRASDEASLIEVEIHTGRPHQIRIHLASVGHPLLGDPLYLPGGLPRPDALPGDSGYLLHAWRLQLRHPASGRELRLEASPPAAFSSILPESH